MKTAIAVIIISAYESKTDYILPIYKVVDKYLWFLHKIQLIAGSYGIIAVYKFYKVRRSG